VDLPTYTNIWRIEKRLYKLYDFRLPMPVPVGQIAVFAAIAVPYVVVLSLIGLPFSHTLLWLYVLPPGALAWLATRPVLEGKRLPELIVSQLRYLGEPRTWCRMAPLAEKDMMLVTARVWRQAGPCAAAVADPQPEPLPAAAGASPAAAAGPRQLARDETASAAVAVPAGRSVAVPASWLSARSRQAASVRAPSEPPAGRGPLRAPFEPPPRPPVTVTVTAAQPAEQAAERPLRMVERALSRPAERRGPGWHDRVVVVPGGHRPGRPDQPQRDRERARQPLPGAHRIVVLGCTAGAGQTMTTLMTGEILASLREDKVAVLDLDPGPRSLAVQARAGQPAPLEVITREAAERQDWTGQLDGPHGDEDVTRIFQLLSARYPLTLADPGAAAIPRVLGAADQLLLVAPASPDAARALAMTREWLEAHGHARLAERAIVVLNGVSRQNLAHVEQAEGVASGRCRAIVRVPWDAELANQRTERTPPAGAAAAGAAAPAPQPGSRMGPAAAQAYLALAGLLVASLAAAAEPQGAGP
jgi:MinD-like ATPase involved in chromosome partitioning or flagellar assembly